MVFTVFSNLKHLQHSDIYLRPEKTIHAGFTFIWQQNKQKSGGGQCSRASSWTRALSIM